MKPDAPIWAPSPDCVARAAMTAFRTFVSERAGASLADIPTPHAWSLAHPAEFWDAVWDYFGVVSELAVRNVIHGRPVQNREALANPEALELFQGRLALRG